MQQDSNNQLKMEKLIRLAGEARIEAARKTRKKDETTGSVRSSSEIHERYRKDAQQLVNSLKKVPHVRMEPAKDGTCTIHCFHDQILSDIENGTFKGKTVHAEPLDSRTDRVLARVPGWGWAMWTCPNYRSGCVHELRLYKSLMEFINNGPADIVAEVVGLIENGGIKLN
jgi:hypothetical protein